MARPPGRQGVSRDFPYDGTSGGSEQLGATGSRQSQRESYPPSSHGRAPAGHGRAPAAHGRGEPAPDGEVSGWRRVIDYPRHGRTGLTRWIPSWKLVGTLCLLGVGFVVTAFLVAYASTPIPDGKPNATFQTTTVYFRDGSVLGRFQQENRTLVTIDQVPDYLRQAVLSAEDRTFETNSGVSVFGMARALASNAKGGSLQGGSTITQQYVKNYYLSADRTYSRKVKEVFIALKLGRTQSKDEILQGYLNTIYWGRGAYGVEAAARVWFGKSLDPAVIEKNPKKQLTRSEAAFLAGIINGPSLYDPTDGDAETEAATGRWQFVVNGMVTQGYITQEEADGMKFPKVLKNVPSNTPKGYKGYLLQMVRKEAEANGFSAEELDTRGYEVYTTFDRNLMNAAEKAVQEALPKRKEWPKGTEVALSSIDVETGEVRAIYGGRDYLQRQRNAATQDVMQAGSTFKPFTLLAALRGQRDVKDHECRPNVTDTAVSLDSRYDGSSPQTFGTFKVRNFGGESFGYIDLRTATANSVNTVYVALNEEVGPEQSTDAAICAGIPQDTLDLKNVQSNVLGAASPHPIDMAFAYATIANEGKRTTLHGLTKVVRTQDKKVMYEYKARTRQVFSKDVTANAIEAMEQVVQRGSGGYARALGRPAAGKTGTASDNYSAWFVGFTPQLSTSVAMYRVADDGSRMQLKGFAGWREITGGSLPVRVWTAYMSRALDGVPIKDFPAAKQIGQTVNPEPSPAQTETPTPTQTWTDQPTELPTPTFTPTETPTETPTATVTDTPTPTETVIPTPTLSISQPGRTRTVTSSP